MRRIRSRSAFATVLALLGLAGQTLGQTGIPTAFQQTTCSTYVANQSWIMMACGQGTSFATLVGHDAATGTVKEMATVADYTMMGKKAIETYTEAIFLIDDVNARVFIGSGTFSSYAAVLKVQNACNQTGFATGTVINAELNVNGESSGAVYFVPHSFHFDEKEAEKAAAALSADDPGETGDYPPNMLPDLTLPRNPNPDTFLPGKYIPGPNAPDDHAERARICYDNYRAACRTAFTNYKNTLANVRNNRLSASGTGAAVGMAVGGGAGLIVLGFACLFLGPPGWATAATVVSIGAAAGGTGGAIAGPTIAIAEAKQAAIIVLKNDTDSALAAYKKCLEAAGYIPNPFYP
ncbi:MAG TPA: hypothetical protein VEB22_14940 [Phycisphaerales bacterium]|nr:hypothetical protein [Phycisphaerales bacterium]